MSQAATKRKKLTVHQIAATDSFHMTLRKLPKKNTKSTEHFILWVINNSLILLSSVLTRAALETMSPPLSLSNALSSSSCKWDLNLREISSIQFMLFSSVECVWIGSGWWFSEMKIATSKKNFHRQQRTSGWNAHMEWSMEWAVVVSIKMWFGCTNVFSLSSCLPSMRIVAQISFFAIWMIIMMMTTREQANKNLLEFAMDRWDLRAQELELYKRKKRRKKTWISANASRLWVRESNVIIFLWLIAVPHSLSALPSHTLLDTKPVQSPRLTSSRGKGTTRAARTSRRPFFFFHTYADIHF